MASNMSSNVILVPINGAKREASILNTALAVAKKLEGHICAQFSRPTPEFLIRSFQEGYSSGAYETLLAVIRQQWTDKSRDSQERFEKWRTAHNLHVLYEPDAAMPVSAEWRELVGDESQILEDTGQLADVIVMAKPTDRQSGGSQERFETALLETGRPLVLAPPHAQPTLTLDRILIAWNRRPQAARAVSSALPVLRQAEEVAVFTKSEGRLSSESASVLVDYLRWHGVRSSIVADRSSGGSAEQAIVDAAKRFKANLLVMGAYSHSRLRETILGGVTRHMSTEATIPVWLMH